MGNSHCRRILPCDFQHILPVGRINLRGAIQFCRGDSKDAVLAAISRILCASPPLRS
jgi:hypothetical protein